LAGSKRYTIMLVPERGGSARTFKVSVRAIRIAVGAFAVVAAAAAGVGIHQASLLLRLSAASATNAALVTENAALVERITGVETRVAAASTTLKTVESLDERIREMTLLNDPSRHLSIGPLPGPEGEGKGGGSPAVGAPLPSGTGGPDDKPVLLERLGLVNLRADVLANEAEDRARSLDELVRYFDARKSLLATTPSIWPVRGYVTSNFGSRVDELTGERRMHPGLDISASIGTPVRAPADGRVTLAAEDYGYGKSIEIDHGRGLGTKYGHLSAYKVAVGAEVKRGDVIGLTGNTGRSTGPHLHYEVHLYGVAENPRRYILE